MDNIQEKFQELIDQLEAIENGIIAANEYLVAIKNVVESNNVLLRQISEKLTDYHMEEMKISEVIKGTVGSIDGKMKSVLELSNNIFMLMKKIYPWMYKPRNGKIPEVIEKE